MCGIFGVFNHPAQPELDLRLHAAIHALRHRGPDDRGIEIYQVADGVLALGQTRLAIIDLSPGGHQPMQSPDGRYTIVFNGEIYNYRELRQDLKALGHTFRTDSDTEVLLAAWVQWGVNGLRRLTGMFAFAVFDRVAKTLTLVRDAFGIKPLFFHRHGGNIYFASEILALLQMLPQRPALNLQRAYNYLVFGSYDNASDTFFQEISHLLPGHWLRIDLEATSMEAPVRWWWPSIEERTDISFEDAAAQLREMFLNNVRLHLRSDVPLGAALSGGMDSSAIVCAMRYLEPVMPIHTFTFVARGSALNEEYWADLVNHQVDAIAHKVVISPNELVDDLDDLILEQGEPFGSASICAGHRVYKLVRESGVTVTLDGQGGDELLAGYDGYPSARIQSLLDKGDFRSLSKLAVNWPRWPNRSITQLGRIFMGQLLPHWTRSSLRNLRIYQTFDWLDYDYLHQNKVKFNDLEVASLAIDAKGRRLADALRHALTCGGLQPLLRHVDRNAMRFSLENRVPFLTHDMAEFLLSLPEHYLLSSNGATKSIFRAAMREIVPDEILDRRDKIGFAPPEKPWLHVTAKEFLASLELAREIPIFKYHALIKDFQHSTEKIQSINSRHWRQLNFIKWIALMNVTIE